jgi:hypothetical protein
MLPVFILRFANKKRTTADLPKQFIARTYRELAGQVAIRRTVIATTTRLMKKHRSVFFHKQLNKRQRSRGGNDFIYHAHFLRK